MTTPETPTDADARDPMDDPNPDTTAAFAGGGSMITPVVTLGIWWASVTRRTFVTRHEGATATATILRHPDPSSDDVVVLLDTRDRRGSLWTVAVVVKPGPSSAIGYAEALRDALATRGRALKIEIHHDYPEDAPVKADELARIMAQEPATRWSPDGVPA